MPDNERISIEDAVPGDTYLCPVCGSPVMVKAANSDNIRAHFAHKRNSPCLDDWKHDMSAWHFEWQSKFPIDSREVVVEKDGVFHRADVLIDDTVIEFQHSPISSEEIEARNSFYKSCGYRVVWLFDVAGKIKDDECFGLVWKRKTTLFDSMKTRIDGLFLQNYLPDRDDLLCVSQADPKDIICYQTVIPIKPASFLKEYGGTLDENVLSIHDIFVATKAKHDADVRMKREQEAKRSRAMANAIFDQLPRQNVKRHRRL